MNGLCLKLENSNRSSHLSCVCWAEAMEDKLETHWEESNSSRGLNACVVSSKLRRLGVSEGASNSNEVFSESNNRDCVLLHNNQRVSSANFSQEVANGPVARVVGQGGITLRKWLDKRERSVDLFECLHIFRQIVEIVNLAHSQGTIVHNVRPSCFTISASNHVSLVQSGSFSSRSSDLSRADQNGGSGDGHFLLPLLRQKQRSRTLSVDSRLDVSPATDSQRAHQFSFLQCSTTYKTHQTTKGAIRETNSEVSRLVEEIEEGTNCHPVQQILCAEINWYTSPEEADGAPSSFSSDIYRLGVLLFELVCTFSSTEEKLTTMSNLRHRVLPPHLLLRLPKEASFCLWLLHPQSSTRPKMSELIQSEFLNEPREEHEAITKLRVEVEEQELLLEFLLQMQQQKRGYANKLHDTIGYLSADIEEVLQKQPLVKRGKICPESNKNECSTSKYIDYQSPDIVKNKQLTSSGSRKRFRPGHQTNVVDRYSDDFQKSDSVTETHDHIHSKSARLMKNFKKLESVYFSTRSRMIKPTENSLNISSAISSNSRGSIVMNGGGRVDHTSSFNIRSNKDRKVGWINPFLEGLNSYLSFSKLKVRVDLNQGDLLNSSNLVCSLSFDRDKEFFASAGVAKKIKVFEYDMILNEDRGIHYPVIEMASKSRLSSICWNSYIKSQIASCDFEGVVQIWDVTRGQVFMEMMEHERRVWSVDFSAADPTKLATGSDDASVKLWNINQGGSIGTIKTKANVCCVQFPPDSAHSLVFGSADHRIYCYDLRNTKIPWCTLVGHNKTVSYVKFLDSTTLVSASTDNSLKLWDLSTCTSQLLDSPLQTFTGHTNAKNFVGLSVCDGYIATGSETDEVFIYHKTFPMPMLSFKFSDNNSVSGHEVDDATQFVSSVCWHGSSSALVAANSTGNIKLLEMI